MAPDTYNKTSHIVTFIHKYGIKGTLVTDDLSCDKVISTVNQGNLDIANEYLMYLNDSKNNRDLSSNEASNELQRLRVEFAAKSELSRFGANVEARQVAAAACKAISTRMKLFETLNTQIGDR